MGDVDSLDIASNKYDTAWSQLLETTVNRGANTSIIVFDKTLAMAAYFVPIDTIVILFSCIVLREIFKIGLAFMKMLFNFIPFM